MQKRILVSLFMFGCAGFILLVSVFRTASVKYEFNGAVKGVTNVESSENKMIINYELAFPGKVMPNSPLWPVKALRDKVWLVTTTNDAREAELLLLLADKRVAASRMFFEQGKPEEGYETLLKAEHYLELATAKLQKNVDSGLNQVDFTLQLALASLKHREVIEKQILPLAPDDAHPNIVQVSDTAKQTFEKTSHLLNEWNIAVPENPFNG